MQLVHNIAQANEQLARLDKADTKLVRLLSHINPFVASRYILQDRICGPTCPRWRTNCTASTPRRLPASTTSSTGCSVSPTRTTTATCSRSSRFGTDDWKGGVAQSANAGPRLSRISTYPSTRMRQGRTSSCRTQIYARPSRAVLGAAALVLLAGRSDASITPGDLGRLQQIAAVCQAHTTTHHQIRADVSGPGERSGLAGTSRKVAKGAIEQTATAAAVSSASSFSRRAQRTRPSSMRAP